MHLLFVNIVRNFTGLWSESYYVCPDDDTISFMENEIRRPDSSTVIRAEPPKVWYHRPKLQIGACRILRRLILALVAGWIVLGVSCGVSATQTPTPVRIATATPAPRPTRTPDPVIARISRTLDFGAAQAKRVQILVQLGQRVEGNLAVRGGADSDVGFSVADPSGNFVVDAERVSGSRGFAFVAAATGKYTSV